MVGSSCSWVGWGCLSFWVLGGSGATGALCRVGKAGKSGRTSVVRGMLVWQLLGGLGYTYSCAVSGWLAACCGVRVGVMWPMTVTRLGSVLIWGTRALSGSGAMRSKVWYGRRCIASRGVVSYFLVLASALSFGSL